MMAQYQYRLLLSRLQVPAFDGLNGSRGRNHGELSFLHFGSGTRSQRTVNSREKSIIQCFVAAGGKVLRVVGRGRRIDKIL